MKPNPYVVAERIIMMLELLCFWNDYFGFVL